MSWFHKLPMYARAALFLLLIAAAFVSARVLAATFFDKGGELFGKGDAVFFASAWAIWVIAYYAFALLLRLSEKR